MTFIAKCASQSCISDCKTGFTFSEFLFFFIFSRHEKTLRCQARSGAFRALRRSLRYANRNPFGDYNVLSHRKKKQGPLSFPCHFSRTATEILGPLRRCFDLTSDRTSPPYFLRASLKARFGEMSKPRNAEHLALLQPNQEGGADGSHCPRMNFAKGATRSPHHVRSPEKPISTLHDLFPVDLLYGL